MNTTLESKQLEFISCSYYNPTPRLQIIRISNIQNWYFERVVLPKQCLLFNAPRNAHLEVHSNEIATAIQVDSIACEQLAVKL